LRLFDPGIRDELSPLAPIVVTNCLLEPGIGEVRVIADDDLHAGRELLHDGMNELKETQYGCAVLLAFGDTAPLLNFRGEVRLRELVEHEEPGDGSVLSSEVAMESKVGDEVVLDPVGCKNSVACAKSPILQRIVFAHPRVVAFVH